MRTGSGREADDQDEAGVGHDLVVGLAVRPSPPSWASAASATSAGRRGPRVPARPRSSPRTHVPEDTPSDRGDGRPDRLRHRQGHGGRAAAPRRLVQARAARPDDPVRPQRRGQDDAAADAGGRDVGRRRRARCFAKGDEVALHDQRPPRERDLSLRDYVLSGAKDLLALEERARRARARDGRRRHRRRDARRVRPRAGPPRARRRLQLARAVNATLHGLGFRDDAPRPLAGDVLRRRADARVAGPRAGRRSRPAAARRADQPPRHRVARVAREPSAGPRRGRRARRPRPLVPGGGRHRGARAGGRPRRASSRARGTRGARRRPRASSRSAARSRSSRPRSPGSSASSTASAPAPARARRSRASRSWTRSSGSSATRGTARRSPSRSSRRSAPAAWSSSSRTGELRSATATLLDDGELWLERGEHVSLVGPNGARQDDADRDAGRPARARRRQAARAATTSRSGCSPSTPRSSAAGTGTVLEAGQRAPG